MLVGSDIGDEQPPGYRDRHADPGSSAQIDAAAPSISMPKIEEEVDDDPIDAAELGCRRRRLDAAGRKVLIALQEGAEALQMIATENVAMKDANELMNTNERTTGAAALQVLSSLKEGGHRVALGHGGTMRQVHAMELMPLEFDSDDELLAGLPDLDILSDDDVASGTQPVIDVDDRSMSIDSDAATSKLKTHDSIMSTVYKACLVFSCLVVADPCI